MMFSKNLKDQRVLKGFLTQADFVRAIKKYAPKVSRQHVNVWESGRSVPRYSNLLAISKALGIDVDLLFLNRQKNRKKVASGAKK